MKKTRIMFISFEEEWKIESEEYILERLVLKLFGVRSEISCSVSKFQTYKNFLINAYRVSTDNSLSRPTHRETFPTDAGPEECLFAIDISRVLTKRSHPARNYAGLTRNCATYQSNHC